MSNNTLPIVEAADGITLFSTWLIAIREDFDFAERAIAKKEQPNERPRADRLWLALSHETIHFLQGMTAALPFSYSLNLLNLCNRLMRLSREGKLNSHSMTRLRSDYKKLNELLASRIDGVSTIDLLEAMAVAESIRARSKQVTTEEFIDAVETYFSDPKSTYRTVIDILRKTFNDLTAFESTSRICFLALNGDNPPRSFSAIVQTLKSYDPWRLSAIEMARISGLDYRASLLAQHRHLSERASTHKILAPYISQLSTLGTLEEVFEFAARPSDWLAGNGPTEFDSVYPPAVFFSGGRALKLGLAQRWTEEQFFMFADTAALVGACQRLLGGSDYYMSCPHTECPWHQSSLCHAWYAIPARFDSCAFPMRFRLHFGSDFETLVKLSTSTTGYHVVGESDTSFQPVIGRTTEEYRKILNDAAKLTDPAKWDRRVISLLSEAEIDDIEHDLLENTAYLVVSVAGYLLDMVANIPSNPFQTWMDSQRRISFSNAEIAMVRRVARDFARQTSPWFGLTLFRALQHILSLSVQAQSLPTWLTAEIQVYASLIKRELEH